MKMTNTKPSWRLCEKRPSVGFDHHYSWGTWDGVVRTWWSQSQLGSTADLYIQASAQGKVHDYPLDPAFMEAERRRVGLTTDAEREALVASSLAKRAPVRPAMGLSR